MTPAAVRVAPALVRGRSGVPFAETRRNPGVVRVGRVVSAESKTFQRGNFKLYPFFPGPPGPPGLL
jgi:hypothetical protein